MVNNSTNINKTKNYLIETIYMYYTTYSSSINISSVRFSYSIHHESPNY